MYSKKLSEIGEKAISRGIISALISAVLILSMWSSATAETPPTGQASADVELQEQSSCELSSGIGTNPPQECNSDTCTETWQQRLGLLSEGDGADDPHAPQMLRIMSLDEVINKCQLLTSSYTWENENDPKSGGPDQANDCKDFANGFRACMDRYGYGNGNHVQYLHLSCYGCDDKDLKKHRINIVKRGDGLWCPIEPQADPFTNNTRYGECCRATQVAAARCANTVHCTLDKNYQNLCCEPLVANVVHPLTCPKDSSWCQNSDGDYVCPPNPDRCQKRGPTPCEQKIQECIDSLPHDATPELRCDSCRWREVCKGDFINYLNGTRPKFAL